MQCFKNGIPQYRYILCYCFIQKWKHYKTKVCEVVFYHNIQLTTTLCIPCVKLMFFVVVCIGNYKKKMKRGQVE